MIFEGPFCPYGIPLSVKLGTSRLWCKGGGNRHDSPSNWEPAEYGAKVVGIGMMTSGSGHGSTSYVVANYSSPGSLFPHVENISTELD